MRNKLYILTLLLLGLPAVLFAVPDADPVDSTGVIDSTGVDITTSRHDDITTEDSTGVDITTSRHDDITTADSTGVDITTSRHDDITTEDSTDVDITTSRHDDITTADSFPDWYVEPVIPEELRAPLRATASGCLTDSVLTFNQDSVLTEVTMYDYDASGRTIRTTVWGYNANGSRIGKSKQEYGFDASGTQVYTGTFAWDSNTNDWRGTAKSEYVYNEAHKMESNITYTWVNNTWLPQTAYTYVWDASGRQTEYTTYTRNAAVNHLVPSKQLVNVWYSTSTTKKTQEINYTAYSNNAWSAGTRKDYNYDANGNQIEYTYYSSLSNGEWVGSTRECTTYTAANKKVYYEKLTWSNGNWVNSLKEIWDFNAAGKQTLHKKYSGAGNDWTITASDSSVYDAAGNNTLVENYTLKNNVWTGSRKEEYTYNSKNKKTNTYKYRWSNNAWVYNTWAVTDYDDAGNNTETANYNRSGNAWVGTGTRTLKTFNSSKKVTEQITQSWPSGATDWVNANRVTTTYSGSKTVQEAAYTWKDGDWLGTSRKDYHYDAAGRNDTIKTYTVSGSDWIYSARTAYTYNAAGETILTHNSTWNGTAWQLVSMSRLDKIVDSAGRIMLNANYVCDADSVWRGVQKDTTAYLANGKTLYTAHYAEWLNGDWVPSYKLEYQYDAAGRTILDQRLDWIAGEWEGFYKYEYAYDDAGRQIMNAIYLQWSYSTNNWVGSSKTERTYSSTSQVLTDVSYVWRNGGWDGFSRYTYRYDAANHEIEKVVEGNSNGAWVNKDKSEKEYRGSQLVKNNAYMWLNGRWAFTSRNEDYYDSDAQAKLRRQIVGSWSNGNVTSFSDKHYFYTCDAPAENGSQPRTPTVIEDATDVAEPLDLTQPAFNLQGQPVDPATYRGVVIQNGRKYLL